MKILKRIVSILLEFLLPQTEKERAINSLAVSDIAEKIHIRELFGDTSIVSLFDYRDQTIKNMIWALKYKKNEHAAELFTQILYEHLLEEIADIEIFGGGNKPLFIPIPLSKEKQKERGFNQTELVMERLRGLDTNNILLYSPTILLRIKNTPSQTRLQNKSDRQENLKGAFVVQDTHEIEGKDIILFDDVITTGSTVSEARKILLNAGVKSVSIIGLAH